MSKLFKPSIEKIETTTKAIQALPTTLEPTLKAITLPHYPYVEELLLEAGQAMTELGEIAMAYFKRFTTKAKDTNTTIGIHDRG
jgi:hypothetical protein